MKYICRRDSETGKKFLELRDRIKLVSEEADKEAKKFGTDEYYSHRWAIEGGIEAIVLNNGTLPDGTIPEGLRQSKDFNSDNVFVPNLKTKKGKEIKKRWDSLPNVSKIELNIIVNHKETMFSNVGYNFNNEEYVGFIVGEKWNVKVPEDCEEITVTKWNELFKP